MQLLSLGKYDEQQKIIDHMTASDFKYHLRNASWTKPNESLILIRRLAGEVGPQIPLGIYEKSWLALKLNSGAMNPPYVSAALIRHHNCIMANDIDILALRYTDKGNNRPEKAEDSFIFAPLGPIFYAEWNENDALEALSEKNWFYTGFILAVEVRQDGATGGLYIIDNSIDDHDPGDRPYTYPSSILGNGEALKFCRCREQFTVALVDPKDGLDILHDSWAEARERANNGKRLGLQSTSRSMPEITLTGERDGDGFPIPLFDNGFVEDSEFSDSE
jgi:hypothetical protein